MLFRRPVLPDVPAGTSVGELLGKVDHWLEPAEKRGV
jgi:precorrin-6A/cobalt-precorrin-6A reductase